MANAQAHYRGIQGLYIAEYARVINLDCSVLRSNAVTSDLSWWRENLPLRNGNPLWQEEPSMIIYSDASLSGWGAACRDQSTGDPWTAEERTRHINVLELKASWLALRSFAGSMTGVTIEICSDSFTAVSYINHKGGTISKHLNAIALQMVNWCQQREIRLTATFIPGAANCRADRESRATPRAGDWQLCKEVFEFINDKWSPDIDLFAAHSNRQLPAYASWTPQPEAVVVNAFSLSWREARRHDQPSYGETR